MLTPDFTAADLDFAKGDGLLPAVVQDAATRRVLMLAYLSPESLAHTLKTGKATFYSRSRRELWTKGDTSGNYLEVTELRRDCDNDTILLLVKPDGPACHTGADTCFRQTNAGDDFLHDLEATIRMRRDEPTEESYTSRLFARGINKIAQKVGEEAVELVIEAKDDDRDLFLGEAADLLYHFSVLLAAKDIKLDEVLAVLRSRRQ